MGVRAISSNQAKRFWIYLYNQAERNFKAYLSAPSDCPYKEDRRTEAEIFRQLAGKFSKNFGECITNVDDIRSGMGGTQTTFFLRDLDRQVIDLRTSLEKNLSDRQKALDGIEVSEREKVTQIYRNMANQIECQIAALEDARANFGRRLREWYISIVD